MNERMNASADERIVEIMRKGADRAAGRNITEKITRIALGSLPSRGDTSANISSGARANQA